MQLHLPVSKGGVGIRSSSIYSPLAYFSSCCSALSHPLLNNNNQQQNKYILQLLLPIHHELPPLKYKTKINMEKVLLSIILLVYI